MLIEKVWKLKTDVPADRAIIGLEKGTLKCLIQRGNA